MGACYAAASEQFEQSPQTQWPHCAIFLMLAFFQLACAMQYGAKDVESAIMAHKWANLFAISVLPPAFLLLGTLNERKSRLHLVVGAIALLGVLHNFLSPFGYRFATLDSTRLVTPWDESIMLFSGTPSTAFLVGRALCLALLVYSTGCAIRGWWRRDRQWSGLLRIAGLAVVTAMLMTSLSDVGLVSLPYLSGFGFLAFSFAAMAVTKRGVVGATVSTAQIRKVLQRRMNRLSQGDPLTKLPNRAGLVHRLKQMLALHEGSDQGLAVFLIDVVRLDQISITHGQAAVDGALIGVAQRIQQTLRDTDLIAREGASTFAVAIANAKEKREALSLVHEKLDAVFASPFRVDGKMFKLAAATGVARYPEDGASAQAVLDAAALALHDAKDHGDSSVKSFRPALREHLKAQMEMEEELHKALEMNQFHLQFQPQVRAADWNPVGMEALIRWRHPVLGNVPPVKFIPLAEKLGLIHAIGEWVIGAACKELAGWHAQGAAGTRMAVNLSMRQLEQPDLEDIIEDALAVHRLMPEDLELEITESVLMRSPDTTIQKLGLLRELGVRLSIDDFGTGYSSLSYLQTLPIHGFKLDRSFIRDVHGNQRARTICEAAVSLARNLDLEITAEGVETLEQAQLLEQLGCHLLQGFLFARPLEPHAALEYLRKAQRSVIGP